jgi:serine/threonine protein kinase
MAEVQVLGTIRHSNIVKLLCCFSCQDTKLLVYKYKENQSLDKWFHGKERKIRACLMHESIFKINKVFPYKDSFHPKIPSMPHG